MSTQSSGSEQSRGAGHIWLALIACLSLGLAPFFPEPHIVGKLRWVAGGGVGMKAMDWFDLIMHGAPFVYLGAALLQLLYLRLQRRQ